MTQPILTSPCVYVCIALILLLFNNGEIPCACMYVCRRLFSGWHYLLYICFCVLGCTTCSVVVYQYGLQFVFVCVYTHYNGVSIYNYTCRQVPPPTRPHRSLVVCLACLYVVLNQSRVAQLTTTNIQTTHYSLTLTTKCLPEQLTLHELHKIILALIYLF